MTDFDETALSTRIFELAIEIRKNVKDFRERHGRLHQACLDGHNEVPRAELLASCRVLPNRLEIVRALRPGGCFAEVGTLYGDFATKVLDIYAPQELHLFDMSFVPIRAQNREKLDQVQIPVHYHEGNSSVELGKLPDAYFDVIYIDADHSYEGVTKDLMMAYRKLKPDGWLVCNDYTNYDPLQMIPYGVYSAVNKFANDHNFKFEFIALAPFGFHDVALRRW